MPQLFYTAALSFYVISTCRHYSHILGLPGYNRYV